MTDEPEFDPEKGEAGKQEGMERALQAAHEHAKQCYRECILLLCKMMRYWNSDNVEFLRQQKFPGVSLGKTRKSVGTLISEAAGLGWCRETVEHHRSKIASNHGRKIQLWESLIYQGNEPPLPPRKRPRRPRRDDPRQTDFFNFWKKKDDDKPH